MIDWLNLAWNALWIAGLAVGLATLSYTSWEASVYKEKFSARLRRSAPQAALSLAGVLFCLGLAGTSQRWWEMGLWLLLGAGFVYQAVAVIRRARLES
jgi:hypothetical protein